MNLICQNVSPCAIRGSERTCWCIEFSTTFQVNSCLLHKGPSLELIIKIIALLKFNMFTKAYRVIVYELNKLSNSAMLLIINEKNYLKIAEIIACPRTLGCIHL